MRLRDESTVLYTGKGEVELTLDNGKDIVFTDVLYYKDFKSTSLLLGLTRIASVNGNLYYILFSDDGRKYRKIYIIKDRKGFLSIVKEFKAIAKKQTGKTIYVFRIDNTLKYRCYTDYALRFGSSARILGRGDSIIDVKTAFLYGDLDKEIYIEQPEGYSEGIDLLYKLRRSLKEVELIYLPTKHMVADTLTKPLEHFKFAKHREGIGVTTLEEKD
ncbi:hypothetical protein G7Y89_g3575 [Cudoniella acicularis]|uniref:Uncharacterized protein n=1 Tax=Cudoniella acicularis TaxID=354080 RepID=A0A8H4RRX5_9HELO|nr:hypothetical protein G7Y89_g3575 [Cudoniella acicularis]